MVKYLFVLSVIFASFLISCNSNNLKDDAVFNAVDVDSIPLIPFPQSLEKGEGVFKMDAAVNFFYPEELSNEACKLMISLIDTCTNSSEPIIKEQGTKTCKSQR